MNFSFKKLYRKLTPLQLNLLLNILTQRLEAEGKAYRKQIEEASQRLAEHANLKSQYEQLALQHRQTKEELEYANEELSRHKQRQKRNVLGKLFGNKE